jgi:hypothetical protein
MLIFTVHMKRSAHGKKSDPDRDLILIKEGFSWPAFFLSGLWALWHRMWLWAFIIIATNVALSLTLLRFGIDAMSQSIISFGLAVIIGMIANDLRRRSLSYKEFREFGVVSAEDVSAAEGRFFDHNPHWVSAFRS